MTTTRTTPAQFIGLFTADGLDLICSTTAEAHRETRDLRAMGCDVARYVAADESTLYAIHDWIRAGVSFATARNRVESGTLHPDTIAEAAEAEAEELARKARAEARKAAEAAPVAPPTRLNGRKVYKAETHPNGFTTVATRTVGDNTGAAPYCVATWWPELGTAWQWGHYSETRAEADSDWREVSARNKARGQAYTTPARTDGMADSGRAPRSLSACATPAHLRDGFDTPAEAAEARAKATPRPAIATGGAFPLRAIARAVYDRAGDRVAEAIEDSIGLYADTRNPFESVRPFVDYPEAREIVRGPF